MINYPKFGDIFMYDFGLDDNSARIGIHPVAVVRLEDQNENSNSIIIAPVTSKYKQSCQITHVLLGKRFGLKKSSVILLEQMRLVDPNRLGRYVGHISETHILRRINQGLKRAIELQNRPSVSIVSSPKPRKRKRKNRPVINTRDVMCLCPVCRNMYRHRGVKLIPVYGTKDMCDLCNYRQGFDYAVVGLLTR